MKKLGLHWQVIIGLVLGAGYAYLSIILGWNDFTMDWITPIGDIFIRILKLIAVPLVLFSIIVGVASLGDPKKMGRLGLKTLFTYIATTITAIIVGLILVNLIKPGAQQDDSIRMRNRVSYELWKDEHNNNPENINRQIPALDSICLSCDSANAAIVADVMSQENYMPSKLKDKYEKATKTNAEMKEQPTLQPLVDVVPSNLIEAMVKSEMIQIIFFAIFFGFAIVAIPEDKRKPVVNVISGLNDAFVNMVWIIMKAMPLFVFALMAGQIVKAAGEDPDKFFELLDFLMVYSGVVITGLLFMIFIFYPTVVSLVVRKIKALFFMRSMRDAQITAFSTSSSVATLPVTMECVQNKIGVSKGVTSFVLPIGATVNMDGTALYIAVAVVSMAQFHMIDLTVAAQASIILTATLASIGAAAVPSAGLVLMMVVLESVGLNPAWIALIFPVDRILDMCRTVVNVTGDGAVSTMMANSENELNIPGE